MKRATVTLFYDKRRNDNTVKLYVTFERKQRLYTTGHKVDHETWERLKKNAFKPNPDGKIKDEEFIQLWHSLFSTDEAKPGYAIFAQRIANQLGPNFTFDRFRELLDMYGKEEEKPQDQTDLLKALFNKEAEMIKQGRIGNGKNFGLVAKSLKRFVDSMTNEERKELGLPVLSKRNYSPNTSSAPVLTFKHVTPDFLKVYEEWMLMYGKAPQSPLKPPTEASPTTVGIYTRHLRVVFNDAIKSNVISRDEYPFGKDKFIIPAGKNPKKALIKANVLKLINYTPIGSNEQRALDFWVLSYLSGGINFADLLSLRWKDIDQAESTFSFIRQKTARTTKGNQTRIAIYLGRQSWDIINRWANADRSPKAYVFPFLSDSMTPAKKKATITQFIKITNKYIRRIADEVGVMGKIGTMTCRHTYATISITSGVPIDYVALSMGHSFDEFDITGKYMDKYPIEKKKEFYSLLL